MDKFDKRTMVDDFIDEQGIVVEFPGDIEDEMVALVKFAQTCLEDAEQAEADNARLRAALEEIAPNYIIHPLASKIAREALEGAT